MVDTKKKKKKRKKKKKKRDYLRAEIYSSLKDAVQRRDTTRASFGKGIVLPFSFTGGPRYMIHKIWQNSSELSDLTRKIPNFVLPEIKIG